MSKHVRQASINASEMMKRFLLSGFVVLTFVAYVIHQRFSHPDSPAQNAGATDAPASQSAGVAAPASTGRYKDGVYTGPVVNAYYGLVQVQATVQNGQLKSVQFLQYPNDRRTSIQINSIAMPYLQQEAIQAQSANVNVISGATLTSQAFYYSLSSALQTATN